MYVSDSSIGGAWGWALLWGYFKWVYSAGHGTSIHATAGPEIAIGSVGYRKVQVRWPVFSRPAVFGSSRLRALQGLDASGRAVLP